MTRQQEKVVLQRLETVRQHKMEELYREKRERRRNVRSANARLVAAMDKTAKIRDKVLETLRTALLSGYSFDCNIKRLPEWEKFDQQCREEYDALDREYAAREHKLTAFADNLAVKLVLGNDADTILALLDQFGSEKF